MAHTRYIGIKKPDAAGSFEAWLFLPQGVPATQPPRNIRRIRSQSELDGPAKAVWAGCPVHVECAEFAMVQPETCGVWGGTTARPAPDAPGEGDGDGVRFLYWILVGVAVDLFVAAGVILVVAHA